ncbi:TAXI family TRAP transporter solute-binding subunit [Salirhabdus salicampi]|uniref:TAXI family TRAP transporter solute-binding subunit n=1 Tax=Salirhabdus salicampi TaxID=476102 RepID=UPI0020C24274|nr:TAXI family TRAP transporter solute-binding subunit [Salirhabdus salicampi]MCP8615252.1 TAXI family TRAP transporter solute-binding subunit [Salirhabdus salicampi]
MKGFKVLAVVFLSLLMIVTAACNSKGNESVSGNSGSNSGSNEGSETTNFSDMSLTFGSATATGNWRIAMAATSQILKENLGIEASAQVTPGADTESAVGVREGIFNGGVTSTLTAERFAEGGNEPFIEPFQLNHWFYIGDMYWNSLVSKDSGITTIDEFAGHKIGVHSPGTINYIFNSEILFPAHGMSVEDLEAELIGTSTAIEHLKDKNIEGMSHARGPSGAIVELTMARDLVLAQPTPEAIEWVKENYPWAGPVKMPKDVYPDLEIPEPGLVFLIPTMSYLDPNLPDDLVYEMTKQVMENFEVIQNAGDAFKDIKPEHALQGATKKFPPHPGALKYYKEANIPGWEEFEYLLEN